ncbi:MAG: PH domain-containing protein [Planctomycetota bacterium]
MADAADKPKGIDTRDPDERAADAARDESRPVDTRPADRAEQAGLPPDSGPEQEVTRIRAAMLRTAPFRFFSLAVMVLGSLGYGGWMAYQNKPIIAALLGVVGLGSMAYLIVWKVQTYACRLRVTNKRTVMTIGLFSRRTTEVLHDNIRNVKIEQNFWQRVWNVGQVSIASSGTDEEEIVMPGVPTPHELARIVDLYRPLG